MIHVSDKWKEAQSDIIAPESFVRISYEVTEPGLHELANVTYSAQMGEEQTANIVSQTDSTFLKYASFEQNQWLLDGTYDVIDIETQLGKMGYVSWDLSEPDEEGQRFLFETPPTVIISFDLIRTQAIPGLTITWSNTFNEYATRFRVTVYNADEQLFTQEYENNSVTTVCDITLVNYTRIVIEVLEWCWPMHHARIERIFLGVTQTYTKTDLISYSHSQSGDLLSGELPKNSVKFSLNNADDVWNPDNPTGNIKYLAERQEIKVQYGYRLDDDIEWIDAGTFWISEWETASNGMEANFSARDAVGFMSETYTGIRKGTLYDIALAAFVQSDIPPLDNGDPRYAISTQLQRWNADFTTDTSDYTNAEIVQLCANAACCVFYQDRGGVLRVEPVRENASGYAIKKFISYTHPEFALTKPLKAVSVNNGLGTANNAAAGEVQTLENVMITDSTNALRVAEWVRQTLEGRKTLSGEYRADPRLDVFDKIAVESKYGVNNAIYITEIEYTYNGAFKGRYAGRVTDFDAEEWYSGELKSGEV